MGCREKRYNCFTEYSEGYNNNNENNEQTLLYSHHKFSLCYWLLSLLTAYELLYNVYRSQTAQTVFRPWH